MTTWPSDPVIYELNTAAWLHDVSQRTGVTATLADVPAAEWDRVAPAGVDAVWLMGVWERGPAGVELAMESAEQVASFRAALPDFDDVRDIQQDLKSRGLALALEADGASSGPASAMLTDPDGNPVLLDQHVPKPR